VTAVTAFVGSLICFAKQAEDREAQPAA
jgi:hypothetical protein